MKCVECGFDNREGAKFCKKCGKGIQLQCPGCAHPYDSGTAFCDECGHDLSKPKEAKPLDYDQPHSYTPKHLAEKILTDPQLH